MIVVTIQITVTYNLSFQILQKCVALTDAGEVYVPLPQQRMVFGSVGVGSYFSIIV